MTVKHSLLFSCRQVARQVSESLEHPLPLDRRIVVIFHLAMCSACRAYRRQVIGLDRLIRIRLRRNTMEQMTGAERERLLKRLRGE